MDVLDKDEPPTFASFSDVFTSRFVRETGCAPQKYEAGVLTVYASAPDDVYIHQRLEFLSGCIVEMIPASDDEVASAYDKYNLDKDKLKGVSEGFKLELALGEADELQFRDLDDVDDSLGAIVNLINTVISTALKKRVSDIHIECYENAIQVKYRIDGVLYPATEELDPAYKSSLSARIKVMAELDIAESRVPQDGRFKLKLGSNFIDFRVSIIPGVFGENIVIRILENDLRRREDKALDLKNMGFSDIQLNVFSRVIKEPHGMVLVTGPTGSGKTTTLYAALNHINDGHTKIITIEDPVEYQLPGIMQIPVNNRKGLTFASGLRSILRHDPDQILVGEIRDLETAEIAVQSALTGHLVLSSVHANSTYDAIIRLQNIGLSINNVLSAVNCVISQRLLRLNCPDCALPAAYTESELLEIGLDIDNLPDARLMESSGCEKCSFTGSSGRTMISEILVVDDDIRQAFLRGEVIPDSVKSKKLVGSENLRKVATKYVLSGTVSLREMDRVTFN